MTKAAKRTDTSPPGWHMAGNRRAAYVSGIDQGVLRSGRPSGYLQSRVRRIDGFGTLMQNISPLRYAGKRIRLSCHLKTAKVSDWAGLWARVDGSGPGGPLAFDNMEDRPVKGTTGWTECTVVLDVDHRATNIAFGILLSGTGTVWIDGMTFTCVDASVPVTSQTSATPEEPLNLGFDPAPDEKSSRAPARTMAWFKETTDDPPGPQHHCSFCRKSAREVDKLIVGGGSAVFICNECVALCVEIIERPEPPSGDDTG